MDCYCQLPQSDNQKILMYRVWANAAQLQTHTLLKMVMALPSTDAEIKSGTHESLKETLL